MVRVNSNNLCQYCDSEINPRVMQMIMKEIESMKRNPPEGVRIDQENTTHEYLYAIIDGPTATPYEGGAFKIKLSFPPNFPKSAPKGYFLTKIFHPNISQRGEICVNTLKKEWSPVGWKISNILSVIRCLLIVPFPESSLNDEAGRMFMDDYNEYFERAKIMTNVHSMRIPVEKRDILLKENQSQKEIIFDGKPEVVFGGSLGVLSNVSSNKPKETESGAKERKSKLKVKRKKKKWLKRIQYPLGFTAETSQPSLLDLFSFIIFFGLPLPSQSDHMRFLLRRLKPLTPMFGSRMKAYKLLLTILFLLIKSCN